MTLFRGIVAFAMVTVCSTSMAEPPTPAGSHEVSLRRSEIDQAIAEIAPHAEQLPLHFASTQERLEVEAKLKELLLALDAGVLEYPDEADLLLRDAVGNGFGHNMGCPDCGEKAIAAYERLLKLQPESKMGNWRYGAFLAQTAEREKSIPYLQKAASLGVVDAHYTAAMVFISLNDQSRAKLELRQYVKANPKDKAAKGLLADVEHGDLHIHIHDGPPPQGVVAWP
jgi:tetratricopeptide (TPR) repeat protein